MITNEDSIQLIDDALDLINESLKQDGVCSITVADVLIPIIKSSFHGAEIREQAMLFNSTLLTIILNPGASPQTISKMKWISIAKAKPDFEHEYLIKPSTKDNRPVCGFLDRTIKTENGVEHFFTADTYNEPITATHIAIVTEPKEGE